ncbi:glycosyltransferase [[Clostridium] fimetarium]|uniref:1,2-diacylglycerol-3-alpha-glucose alpha-1,2-glucosyltransferase n=1 Tax=[Clostridium] fimetarium TaxID=99656 RepID=A0A1I0Q7U7_9FIRM|nr:glycosyltransferase [[Clostridium] fimetarium]SEW22963.1 1,2-diacylglycerol-3-alpha-glucose alpha-1,2-glucosyltransferase [[Clostridium] fimetarium]
MKVLLYHGGIRIVNKSGIGVSYEHQKKALFVNHIPFTLKFKNEYDIAQFNTIFPDSAIAAYILKRKGKKIIYYGHSTMEDFKKSFRGSDFFAPLFKKWIKFCYGLGDVIITPTNYSKKLLESYGIEKPIYAISNGIDLDFYKRESGNGSRFREKYDIKDNEKVIISVGHYIERKGIIDFLKLAGEMPEYKFIWFGHTNLRMIPTKIKEAIHNKTTNVFFPGYVSNEELRDAYVGSDLFLFLTYEETEGIVLLEAMAMKIPIIIRDIPIYQQEFIHGKSLYKGTNIVEFENLAQNILCSNILNITNNAYELVKEKEISNVGNKLKDIYKNVLLM